MPPAQSLLRPLGIALAAALLLTDAAAAQTDGTGEGGSRWQVAPVRWRGWVGLAIEQRDFEDDARSLFTTEQFNLEGSSYIWQPWFAQVAAGLGLFLTQERRDEYDSGLTSSASSNGATGRLQVRVFPVSRFPFTLDYEVTDTRTSGELVGTQQRNNRIGVRQNYRDAAGTSTYGLSADHSVLTSPTFGRDQVDNVNATSTHTWQRQQLQMNASYIENQRDRDDAFTKMGRLSILHNYRPPTTLLIDSMLSVNRDERGIGGRFPVRSLYDLRQISSYLNWQPASGAPLTVVASARLTDTHTEVNGAGDSTARTATAAASAGYWVNPNLNLYGGIGATALDSGQDLQTLSLTSLGAIYQIDPRQWGKATYTAQLGANGSVQTGGIESPQTTGSVSGSHNLSAPLGKDGAWYVNLGQAASAQEDSLMGGTQTLTNTASLSWRLADTEGLSGYAGLSVGDSRTWGRNASTFQLANLQLSGQWRMSQYSSFTANLTLQATWQTYELDPVGPFRPPRTELSDRREQRNVGGGASYQHLRAFGVRGLRYTAQFNAYNTLYDTRQQGDPNAPLLQPTWSFEQRLEQIIGRLEWKLIVRFAEFDGKKNASALLSVNRYFGS